MNNEDLYKRLYESSVEETNNETKEEFMRYVLEGLKSTLSINSYYDFTSFIVLQELKSMVDYLEDDNDQFETPDNKARDLSAAYRVIEYHSTEKEYKAYVQGRRDILHETP